MSRRSGKSISTCPPWPKDNLGSPLGVSRATVISQVRSVGHTVPATITPPLRETATAFAYGCTTPGSTSCVTPRFPKKWSGSPFGRSRATLSAFSAVPATTIRP
jgi:hypothetical protein